MTVQHRGRRGRSGAILAAGAALSLLAGGPAFADDADWTASPGTTVEDGALVLDTTDPELTPDGTSYETTDLGIELEPGDVISFDYALEGATCGGGQPRIFVEVDGAYENTFDGNEDACGEGGLGSTSGTVTYTYDGEAGTVGHAGIVFDNVSDRGIATITDVSIGDYDLELVADGGEEPEEPDAKDACKDGGWEDQGFRNQGQCIRYVNTGKDSR